MNDKSKVKFEIIAFVVLLTALALVGCTSGATIYVPTDYPTIQQAIDAALPGDRVFVWNGTYYESVMISNDSITLQGEDANTTTIHGKWLAEKVVYVSGNYVNISGFTVTSSSQFGSGIYLDGSSNCILYGNIANSNRHGINLDSSDNNTLTNNIASDNDYGIWLCSSCNNTLTGNTASNNDYGIWLWISSNNNTLTSNIASNNSRGIFLYSSSSNTLTGNIASDNSGYGIKLDYSSDNNRIIRNIADSNDDGICLVSTSTKNNITENNISNNDDYGIYLDYSGGNEIYHNNFINNNKQAYDYHGFNEWDKGPIIGGNYWIDHVCHGNPSNGTEPYLGIDTDAGAVDNYPFEDPNGWVKAEQIFDTGPGTYPSIFGLHNGTITLSTDITVSKMFTYPCTGTGGHSEYVRIWGNGTDVNRTWNGYYSGDWHNITFAETFTLKKGIIYNYAIKTGSYPQIIHKQNHTTLDGSLITCSEFIDANGKKYDNWIPAIRLV